MAMARLGAAMAEQQPLATGWIQAHRDQCRDRTDKAVNQHRDAFLRAGQIGANQRGNLEPTEIEQRLQGIATLCGMQRQSAFDDVRLVADASGIQPGAGTGQVRHRAIEQGTGQRTGRRGIADAHLAADEQLGAGGFRAQDAVATACKADSPCA